jgi:hypothetical protein
MNATFDTWLAKQFAEGLVDIKFAVVAGKGVSVEAVQNELLTAEACIASGFGRSAPHATSAMSKEVSEFLALN